MAGQPVNFVFMPPNFQMINNVTISDIRNNLSMKEIEDMWLLFRNYDVGQNFGNLPPIGDIGVWALYRKYRNTYYQILRPLFIQLTQLQNGQLIFYSNDMSDDPIVIDKNANRLVVATIQFEGNDFQQAIWDELLVAANNLRFYGRIVFCMLISY